MPETRYRLDESRSVDLDAVGFGQIIGVGPVIMGERWIINLTSVSSTVPCTFRSFRGTSTDPSRQIDVTVQGEGDSSNTEIELRSGESVSFMWSDGSTGVGTVHLEGDRYIPGIRAGYV